MTAVAGLTATQPIASSMTVFAADNDKVPAPAETNTFIVILKTTK